MHKVFPSSQYRLPDRRIRTDEPVHARRHDNEVQTQTLVGGGLVAELPAKRREFEDVEERGWEDGVQDGAEWVCEDDVEELGWRC
jgi:hypothetical protein